MDEEILDAMAYYDQTYELAEDEQDVLMYSGYFERPSTADRGDDSSVRPLTGTITRHFLFQTNTVRSHDSSFTLFRLGLFGILWTGGHSAPPLSPKSQDLRFN